MGRRARVPAAGAPAAAAGAVRSGDTRSRAAAGGRAAGRAGGIGPTHDDITSAAVAKALGREFGRNAEAEAVLRGHYRPEEITEVRLRMADMPEGAELLNHPVSRAPGFRIENVIVMAGVPSIMRARFDGYKHDLVGGDPVVHGEDGGRRADPILQPHAHEGRALSCCHNPVRWNNWKNFLTLFRSTR